MRTAPLLLLLGCSPYTKEGEHPSDYALLDLALEGLGGEDALTSISTMSTNGAGTTSVFGQGYTASDHAAEAGTHEFVFEADLVADALYWDWSKLLSVKGIEDTHAWSELILGGRGIEIDADGVSSALPADGVGATRNLSALLMPALALRAAVEDTDRISLGEDRTIDGQQTYALAIVLDDAKAPLTLDLDTESGEILAARITEEDQVLGDAEVSVRFKDWAPALDGDLRFPGELALSLAGEELYTATTWSAQVTPRADSPLSRAAELVGEGSTDLYWERYGAGRAIWLWRFAAVHEPIYDAELNLSSEEIVTGSGAKLVTGGGHNSLLAKLDDGVVLIDIPTDETEVGSLGIAVAGLYPGRAITTAVLTHAHHDHAGGLRALAAAGVTLVVPADLVDFVETVLSASFVETPDALANSDVTPVILPVPAGGSLTLGSGENTVVLHAVENSHAEVMIYAWVPAAGAVYASDLFAPDPDDNAEPLNGDEVTTAVELYNGVDGVGLEPDLIAGSEGSFTSWDDFVRRCFGFP